MRLLIAIGVILLVGVLQSHCQQDQDLTIGPTQQNLDLVSKSVTNLAQKISLAIASPKSKTELFSPVSIAGALSLLLLGSGGATRDELINVLGFQGQSISFADIHKSFGRLFQELVSNEPSMTTKIPWRENDKCNSPDYDEEEDEYQPPPRPASSQGSRGKRDADSHYISVANGVFLDDNLVINPYYELLTKELYAGEVSRKPLLNNPVLASYEINQWVKQATKNKISEIVVPEQVSNSPMVLASALYFKAKWQTMFIEPDTRARPFFINGRELPPVDVETMATSGCFPFYEEKHLNAKIVGLPYEEGKSTMYIVMPNYSDRQKIRNLQNILHVHQLNELIDRMVVKTGTILLPKMKLDSNVGLKEVLVSEGLNKIFSPYQSNLTEITKGSRIFENIDRINQHRTTSRPTQTQPPPIPTQTTHRPNTPNKNNTNPRAPVAANSDSQTQPPLVQLNPALDVTPTVQPLKVALNENECNLTNNCIYDGYSCNYYNSRPIYTDDRGCFPRPCTIQQNCPPERQVFKDWLCLADSHLIYSARGGQCAPHCVQLKDLCFCCKSAGATLAAPPPAQQTTTSPPTTDSSPTNVFEVANRFNAVSSPTRVCQTSKNCNQFGCQLHTLCALVNYDRTYLANNAVQRSKRQTRNSASPPNLYVGNILHKVSLDINEQGTEGGAVTAVVIDRISSAFNMRVDGPFIIYLRNDVTKLPLFYGAVFDPRS